MTQPPDKHAELRQEIADTGGAFLDTAQNIKLVAALLADHDAALATIQAQHARIAALEARCQVAIPTYRPRNSTSTPAPGGALE